jgi:hypothetical protein
VLLLAQAPALRPQLKGMQVQCAARRRHLPFPYLPMAGGAIRKFDWRLKCHTMWAIDDAECLGEGSFWQR